MTAQAPDVLRILERLGRTPQEIAWTLYDAGATGVPHDPTDCVLANHLAALGVAEPIVANEHVSWRDEDDDIDCCKLPAPVVKFVDLFDIYAYRGLIAEGIRA